MNITITLQVLRKLEPVDFSFLKSHFPKGGFKLTNFVDDTVNYPNNHRLTFRLGDFTKEDLTKLWSLGNRNDFDSMTMNKIIRWTEAISSPLDKEVPSLTALHKMLSSAITNDNKYRWLMRESEDGYTLPYLVDNVVHHPSYRDSPEHVTVELKHAYYYSEKEYTDEEKCKTKETRVTFYAASLRRTASMGIADDFEADNMYDLGEIEEGNVEAEDDNTEKGFKGKKKQRRIKSKTKTEAMKLLQVLSAKNLYFPSEASLTTFFEHSKLCVTAARKIGAQFTCSSKAWMRDGSYNSKFVKMQEEGVPYKIVVDMRGIAPDVERQEETDRFGLQLLPYHPYVRCYNLTKYSYVDVHAASLTPYKWHDNIIDNMVAEDGLKEYLSALIGSEHNFVDIVEGKSGGMIILASGDPGIGKTLTAEVFSEKMRKPLYQIQASQLGIKISEIETNISSALRRAERLNAVLLLDECDTYVRKRGKDIKQNCIVGIFLKLLEYFNGVMFMTTNKHDIVDAAIMSRCTAHIKYEMPDEPQRKKILLVHAAIQNITLSETEAGKIAKKYIMSGRDIRNMYKNVKKFHAAKMVKGKLTLTVGMITPIEKYTPFVK